MMMVVMIMMPRWVLTYLCSPRRVCWSNLVLCLELTRWQCFRPSSRVLQYQHNRDNRHRHHHRPHLPHCSASSERFSGQPDAVDVQQAEHRRFPHHLYIYFHIHCSVLMWMIIINLFIIIISHLTIAGSLIGGIPETQVSKIILPHCLDLSLPWQYSSSRIKYQK